MTAEPSEYELREWQKIQNFQGRTLSRAGQKAGEAIVKAAKTVHAETAEFIEHRPALKAAVDKTSRSASKSIKAVKKGAAKAIEVVPDGVTDWTAEATEAARRTVSSLARTGLTPASVIKKHRKKAHDVSKLYHLQRLDLEQIDDVRGNWAKYGYPAAAAASGIGTAVMITGGQLAVPASGGVSTAPSAGIIAGAFIGDITAVLAISSRSGGEIALSYGYDPEDPTEKLFLMSAINAGTAASATAKTAAFADISRLTQALVRGKTWEILDKSVLATVSKQFAKLFGSRLTKQGLGKIIPAAGVVLGGVFNWSTLESIVDTTNMVYRRRFLLDKYPAYFGESDHEWTIPSRDEAEEQDDEVISVMEQLDEALEKSSGTSSAKTKDDPAA